MQPYNFEPNLRSRAKDGVCCKGPEYIYIYPYIERMDLNFDMSDFLGVPSRIPESTSNNDPQNPNLFA